LDLMKAKHVVKALMESFWRGVRNGAHNTTQTL
jgi:hypothetical protein